MAMASLNGESDISNVTQPYLFEPTMSIQSSESSIGHFPESRQSNDNTECTCGKCLSTLNSNEIGCCRLSNLIERKLESCSCITETESFKAVCLDKTVLYVSFRRIQTIRKKRRKQHTDVFNNKACRWTAYGQFIFWIYDGPIGQSVRKVLPTCVYNTIRFKFPSDDGIYSDFKVGVNDDIFIE